MVLVMVTSKLNLFLTTAVWVGLMTSPLYAMEDTDSYVTQAKKQEISNNYDFPADDETSVISVRQIFRNLQGAYGKEEANQSLIKAVDTLSYEKEWKGYLYHIMIDSSRQVNELHKTKEWRKKFRNGISFIQGYLNKNFPLYDESYISTARKTVQDIRFYSSQKYAGESLEKALTILSCDKEWKGYFYDIILNSERPIHFRNKPVEWVRSFHQGLQQVNESLLHALESAKNKLRAMGHLSDSPSISVIPITFDHWSYYER
jgi:hypothetical protein